MHKLFMLYHIDDCSSSGLLDCNNNTRKLLALLHWIIAEQLGVFM